MLTLGAPLAEDSYVPMTIGSHYIGFTPVVGPPTMVTRSRLRAAVEAAQQALRPICVIHIDLDRFHEINQRWGQQVGDHVLNAVGRVLSGVIPVDSLLAAVEGDAFVMMVSAADPVAAQVEADMILLALRPPVAVGDLTLTVEATAGFAVNDPADSANDLLEQAFLACRRAKATRRGCAVGYEASLGVDSTHGSRTQEALRTAIDGEQLRMHVQPTVDLRDGLVVGVEALVRWQHPVDGLLAPADFLPAAESAGLMTAIGDWVLDEAIRLVGHWRLARPGDPLRIWVNLAAQQLADGDHLLGKVRDSINAGLITAHDIGFEVTESSLLIDLPNAVGTLSALRGLGVEIALDDFGTGYSSLTYLRQLPVTAVKIDRSFVAGIGGSLADEAIIEAVIDLAHALGLRVIAEGVETSVQVEALIRMGADEAQGFHFSSPQPGDQVGSKLGLPWCGAPIPSVPTDRSLDRRADEPRGLGSARARLLLTALDTVHDSIIVTSAAQTNDGNPPIVYVNPAFEAETGHRAADVVGQSVETLLADPGDLESMAWFRSVHAGGSAATRELASRRADGTTFLCEVTLSPILDERGIHTHWLHVRRDLTLRRAEANDRARFQSLIEQSSSLVAIAESGGEWVYANNAQRVAVGLGPNEPLFDISDVARFGQERTSLSRSAVLGDLRRSGRWSGPVVFTNRVTGAITEVISDVHVVDDALRPGVKVYASLSRDVSELNALERAESRRRQLFGFAAALAQRALAKGRDELFKNFDSVLAECGELLVADFAYVDTIDLDAGQLRPLGTWHSDRCTSQVSPPDFVDLAVLPTWVERLGRGGIVMGGVAADDWPWHDELGDVFSGPDFRSSVAAGLNVDGVLVGVFGLARIDADRVWTADELATVQQAADTIANLLGRERADRAKFATERHLVAMLSNVRDILVVIDRDGWIRYANRQITTSTGHAVDQVVGQRFLSLVHPDDAETAIERFARTLAGDKHIPVTELRIVFADGTANWYDVDTSGIEDPVLGGYVVSLRDISVQHALVEFSGRRQEFEHLLLTLSHWALNVPYEKIEGGLAEHLRQLGELLHTDAAGVWLIDRDTIRTAAHWADPMSGSTTPPPGAMDAPAVTDFVRAHNVSMVVDDIEAHDEPWAVEWRRLPGHDRSALLMPLVSAQVSLGIVGVTMATTARAWAEDEIALVRRVADTVAALLARQAFEASLRASEARLVALLDGSLDLVVVVTPSGEILYANRTVHRSLGFSQDEIVGTNIAQVVHADDLELALQRLQSLAADETTELTTLRVIARNGSVHWIEISSGRLQNPIAGGTVLTCRDVTGRHAVEADAATRVSHLRYAFEVAQAALDLEVDEFLIGLSGVCANIARMLGVDLVYVDRIDEQQHLITNLAGWVGNGAVQRVSPGETLPCTRLPLWVERLRCLEPVVMNDAATSSEPWAIEKREALGSEGGLMAIAMSAAGELFGVFGVSMVQASRVWSDDEVAFLRIIGETVAHVLERARMDDALRRSESRFRSLSETAADVVLLMDSLGMIQYASPSSIGLLGFTPDEMLGRIAQQMVHPDDVERLSAVGADRLHLGTPQMAEYRLRTADGSYVWVSNSVSAVLHPVTGVAVEYRASLRDISERKRLQVALEEQALHDPLTGLGNRVLLQQKLCEATNPATNPDDPDEPIETSVLLIDLDGFKVINDTYGHAAGDDALRVISARLAAITRRQDTLARTGGDEFVVICPQTTASEAVQIGERIVRAARHPLSTEGMVVLIGASVGVAHHLGRTSDPGWLLIEADHAMYAAKREGRGRVRVSAATRTMST